MGSPLKSLMVAIVLLAIGAGMLAPVSGVRVVLGADGRPVVRADGRPVLERDPYAAIRINWPGYTIMLVGTAALGWTLFLVACGVVSLARGATAHVRGPKQSSQATAASRLDSEQSR